MSMPTKSFKKQKILQWKRENEHTEKTLNRKSGSINTM